MPGDTEERLSAVARRRQLNGAVSSGRNTPKSPSRRESPARALPDVRVTISEDQAPSILDTVEQYENSFSALVSRDVVQFSNFREVERLTDDSIKIRLSKAQQCMISGRFSLWMKEGAIELFGAKLEASSDLHPVYAPSAFEVSPILALTAFAEFEIFSHGKLSLDGLGFPTFIWTSAEDNHSFHGSFFVHGYSNLENGVTPDINQFDSSLSGEIVRKMNVPSTPLGTVSPPRILLCGKQSPGTAMATMAIINSMMTSKLTVQNKIMDPGILFLDLDADLPMFTPPGTESLVRIYKPMLGPPFVHSRPIHGSRQAQAFEIVEVRYVDRSGNETRRRRRLNALLTSLKDLHRRDRVQLPVLIKANGYLGRLETSDVTPLARVFDPTLVVRFGSETGSNSGRLGELLATKVDDCSFASVTVSNNKDTALHTQHELLLRSYFHSSQRFTIESRWTSQPIELNQRNYVCLTYGNSTAMVFDIFFSGLQFKMSDAADSLNGVMVAVCLHASSSDDPQDCGSAGTSSDRFLGYGIVASCDIADGEILLMTPIPSTVFEFHQTLGNKVDLIVQQADLDGRFDTAWALLECEPGPGAEKSRKTLHSRRFGHKGRL